MKRGFVYIMANDRPTLYTGVTSDLIKRVAEHRENWFNKSFTAKYTLHKLVYYEVLDSIESAIIREKQIKDMDRNEKLKMIRNFNPNLVNLYEKVKGFD